jgi:inosine-uridine nucleoside N-ribohydrolase
MHDGRGVYVYGLGFHYSCRSPYTSTSAGGPHSSGWGESDLARHSSGWGESDLARRRAGRLVAWDGGWCELHGHTMMALAMAIALQATAASPQLKLIIDTDIGGGGCKDVDDVVAICVANALTDNGETELLAVVQNTAPLECAGAISVLNHFYGRGDLPVGAYDIRTAGATLELGTTQGQQLPYVSDLVQRFDSRIKNSTQAEDAVATYRRVLASQPDRSVAISSIGIHTNLAALLRSGPDAHSPLRGRQLVARKVALLAVMGGTYPYGGPNCNLQGGGPWLGPGWASNTTTNGHNHLVASAAASYVAQHWPPQSKIIWSGCATATQPGTTPSLSLFFWQRIACSCQPSPWHFVSQLRCNGRARSSEVGSKVESGGALFQKCPVATASNPCAQAVINYEGRPNKPRMSWDPLTTLVAVRGAAAASTRECTDCDGHNTVSHRHH